MSINIAKISTFPIVQWHTEPSLRWLALCEQLGEYDAVTAWLEVTTVSRKWELVSAYQKSVRRGLTEMAEWLATGFVSLGSKEWAFCWRRICSTATEDVGYGDPELMNFVIACSTVYRVANGADVLRTVWLFLTRLMCEAQMSVILRRGPLVIPTFGPPGSF
jgi:hypothetical protein